MEEWLHSRLVWRHRSLVATGSQSRGPLCKQQMCRRFRARAFKLSIDMFSFHMLVRVILAMNGGFLGTRSSCCRKCNYSIVIVILLSLYCHIVLIPNHSAAHSTHPDPGQLINECLMNE